MSSKRFHIGDILSATTGRLVSPRYMGGVYDILNWMTGDDLMTHQLPRASRECEDPLKAQFPDLAAIVVPDDIDSEVSLLLWLDSLAPLYGTHREVRPLDPADHTHIDPLDELAMHYPNTPVIAVVVDGEGNA